MLSGYYINAQKYLARLLIIQNYVVPAHYRCLYLIAKAVAPNIIRSLARKQCPYCGRAFKYRSGLYLHLNNSSSRLVMGLRRSYSIYKNPCYVRFQMLLDEIIDLWVEVKRRYRRGKKRHTYKVDGWKVVDSLDRACLEALKVVLKERGEPLPSA